MPRKIPKPCPAAKTKPEIHQLLIAHVRAELDEITIAAKKTFATATSEEHRAESKYDTFKLEASFLSRGLAKRVEELTRALQSLETLPLFNLTEASPVQVSALVRLKTHDGKIMALFLGSDAGGETITVDGEDISIISSQSPMGLAVQGKHVGDTFTFQVGQSARTFSVLSVE